MCRMKRRNSSVAPMSRRRFLGSLAGVASAQWIAQPGPRPERRPNILLILTDQQSATMLSCAGNPWLKTPAMDSLATTGVRFSRTYVTNPVCLPSRFSLFTGRYPSFVGVRHNGSEPTARVEAMPEQSLGHLLRQAGYDTAYCGKVHLPGPMNDIERCGFELLTKDQREGCARAAVEYLHRRRTRPFFLVVSFINPHDICYMAIEDYYGNRWRTPEVVRRTLQDALRIPERVSREEFFARLCPPLPDNFEVPCGEPDAITWLVKLRPFRQHARLHWGEEKWRLHRWAYCRLTERVDSEIGMVLDALKTTGLEESTLVILTSDHGDMDAAHRLEHKTVFYEESARVPLIVRPPGSPKPARLDESHLISSGLDLFVTICDYAGARLPSGLPGRSLRPLIEGESVRSWRETLVVESQIGYMITDGRYKYCAYDPDKGFLRDSLVDLETDPGEMFNLVGEGLLLSQMKRLREAMSAWLRDNAIDFSLPPIHGPG